MTAAPAGRPTRRQVMTMAGVGATGAVLGGTALATAGSSYAMPVNLSGLVAGTVDQVVLTVASNYRNPQATVSGWARRDGSGWQLARGPYGSWIGAGGFAPAGRKREGDGHSPTGVFGIPLTFGATVRPPGVTLPFRALQPPYDIWVENSSSRYYNELVDLRRVGARAVGDRESPLTYPLGAFIAYNSRRVPHLGSAIFLHPSHASPTIGCVSIPIVQLKTLLTWLRPAARPMMVMGVSVELLSLGGRVPRASPSPGRSPTETSPPTPSPSGPADTAQPVPTELPTPGSTPSLLVP